MNESACYLTELMDVFAAYFAHSQPFSLNRVVTNERICSLFDEFPHLGLNKGGYQWVYLLAI